MDFNTLLSQITQIAKRTDINIFLVGGAVRDILLGRENLITDLDISVEYEFKKAVEMLASGLNGNDVRFSRFSTASFKCSSFNIDIVTARREIYEEPGMLPKIIPARIEDDLRRRDFTMNSIAFNPSSGNYTDTKDGMKDLKNRIVRQNRRGLFIEDPTRIFRLIKYSERFKFDIEMETFDDMKEALKNKQLFKNVSKSRISREWHQIFAESERESIVDKLISLGVMNSIFGSSLVWNSVGCEAKTSFQYTVSLTAGNDPEQAVSVIDMLENGITKGRKKDVILINKIFRGKAEPDPSICRKYASLLKEYCDNIHS